MVKTKRLLSFVVGCVLSAVVALVCWGVLDFMFMETHPYLIVVFVNLIGYLGHGVTAYIVRKYILR